MKIIAMDISGNYKEGKGTTGICVMEDGVPKRLDQIHAGDFDSDVEYWNDHVIYIARENPKHLILEGYKLYNHGSKKADMQTHSELETSQLLGALKLWAYSWRIPVTVQFAHEVKSRWSDHVLVNIGQLEKKGNRHYWNGQLLNNHKKDSLRHALHWWNYGRKKK